MPKRLIIRAELVDDSLAIHAAAEPGEGSSRVGSWRLLNLKVKTIAGALAIAGVLVGGYVNSRVQAAQSQSQIDALGGRVTRNEDHIVRLNTRVTEKTVSAEVFSQYAKDQAQLISTLASGQQEIYTFLLQGHATGMHPTLAPVPDPIDHIFYYAKDTHGSHF